MKRMAAALVGLALVLGLGGAATAGTLTLHPGEVVPGCGACPDDVGNVFGLTFLGTVFSQTSTPVGVGSTFTDFGALSATSLTSAEGVKILPGVSGLDVTWQLGAIFSVPGTITGAVTDPPHSAGSPLLSFTFTPGSTITLYAEPLNALSPQNPNNPATIADGTVIGVLSLLSGGGNLDFVTGDGNIDLVAQFTSVLDGFWDNLGVEVDLGTQAFFAFTNSNNHVQPCASPGTTTPPPPGVPFCSDPTAAGVTATSFTDFFELDPSAPTDSSVDQTWLSIDGSASFAVAGAVTGVPNPSALMLIGSTLICAASVGVFRSRRTA